MKNVGRGPLGRGEAGVKVGDDDLGQMTSKSGEKTFLSQDEILLAREVARLSRLNPYWNQSAVGRRIEHIYRL